MIDEYYIWGSDREGFLADSVLLNELRELVIITKDELDTKFSWNAMCYPPECIVEGTGDLAIKTRQITRQTYLFRLCHGTTPTYSLVIIANKMGQNIFEDPYATTIKNLAKGPSLHLLNLIHGHRVTRRTVFDRNLYVFIREPETSRENLQKAFFEQYGMIAEISDDEVRENEMRFAMTDVFICHDSRDKEAFVRELAQSLVQAGLTVWYDDYSLSVGDSLIDAIDRGLEGCRFGVIVISRNFLSRKKWSHRELNSLTQKEVETGRKTILPIWLDVSYEDVARYSRALADKYALRAIDGLAAVASRLVAEVKRIE